MIQRLMVLAFMGFSPYSAALKKLSQNFYILWLILFTMLASVHNMFPRLTLVCGKMLFHLTDLFKRSAFIEFLPGGMSP